jgi:aspartate racemase
MKIIGLLGGMSWESTLEYYRIINQEVKARRGGLHSARCLLYSVDFAEIEALQHLGQWSQAGALLAEAARRLELGGAEFLVLCTNTMHKVADDIQAGIGIPLLNIADATAEKIKADGISRVGLLGTRFTMEQDFYRGRLEQRHGLNVVVPEPEARDIVHRVIYDELCRGVIRDSSRAAYRGIIAELVKKGAQGIIAGCTEIELLVRDEDSIVPLFPTTRIHAVAAVDRALQSTGSV